MVSLVREWVLFILLFILIHNILPNRKHDNRQSPHEAMFGNKPDVGQIRVWGCTVWYALEKHERKSKLSPVSVPAINLGCDSRIIPPWRQVMSLTRYLVRSARTRQGLCVLRGSVGTQECSLVPMHLVGVSPPILVRSGVPS